MIITVVRKVHSILSADHTAPNMIGYWHDNKVFSLSIA